MLNLNRAGAVALTLLALLILPSIALAQAADAPSAGEASPMPGEQAATQRPPLLVCTSKPGERNACAADTSRGVALVRSTGEGPCLLGRTWGYDDKTVWVSDGCSGEFVAGETINAVPEKQSAPEYVPNAGFKLFDGENGQIYMRLFTYARYLNQRNINDTYTDAFGNTKTIQVRQDAQLQKFFLPFSGWFMSPKFRYYLYVWSANTSQGDAAQVVGGGNISYVFNRYATFGAGITSLPSVRSTEGQFPVLADGRHAPHRRRVFPRLVYVRLLDEGRHRLEAEVPRHVRQQPQHARRQRLSDRQQDEHAVIRAAVDADDG